MNLLNDKQIQFACVVNNKGRIVTGQFDKIPIGFDKDFEIFLMEIALEFSMKREFDNKFGKVEYIFSKRSGVNITCIPFNDDVLAIISQKHVEPQEIIKKCMFFLEPSVMNLVL